MPLEASWILACRGGQMICVKNVGFFAFLNVKKNG